MTTPPPRRRPGPPGGRPASTSRRGGLVAPLLIDVLGPRGALVAVGLPAPATVAASRPALRRLDGEMRIRDADIEILRAVPMLGVLPAATIEQLGAGLEHAEFAPGQVVFEQGDRGDRFSVVESGRAEVARGGRRINTLGRGDGLGEIALLGVQPRTATVGGAPDAPLRVSILQRPAFLPAVTGYPVSATVGQDVVAQVRARDPERLPATTDDGGDPLAGAADGSAS